MMLIGRLFRARRKGVALTRAANSYKQLPWIDKCSIMAKVDIHACRSRYLWLVNVSSDEQKVTLQCKPARLRTVGCNEEQTATTSAVSRRHNSSTPSRPTPRTSSRLGRLLLTSTASSPISRCRRRDLDAGAVVHHPLHSSSPSHLRHMQPL